MKNELMNHIGNWMLLSLKSSYVMYTSLDWENLAKEKSINRARPKSSPNKAYATTVGKKWLDDCNKNINKTSNPKDCSNMIKAMWNAHIYSTKEEEVVANIQSKFAKKYICIVMDRQRSKIFDLISSEEVFQKEKVESHTIFSIFILLQRMICLWKQRFLMKVG